MPLRMDSLQHMLHFRDYLIDAFQNREPSAAAAAVTSDFKEIFIRLGSLLLGTLGLARLGFIRLAPS
jgi:hypothetical protein